MMKNLREILQRFMIGRYGSDGLGRCLAGMALLCWVANVLIRGPVLSGAGLLLLFIVYYRMFSRNIGKRVKEMQAFEGVQLFLMNCFVKYKFQAEQLIKYHIYHCPECQQKIRIPRGKGKISIHCPKCHADFIKKS